MNTLAFRSNTRGMQSYLVLAHTSDAPDAGEWTDYVQCVSALMLTARGTVRAFVATDGGSPNAAQRKQLSSAFGSGSAASWTHVFTTDAFIRGVVTAFSWIGRAQATAHPPAQFSEVCRTCGLPPGEVFAHFAQLRAELPKARCLGFFEPG